MGSAGRSKTCRGRRAWGWSALFTQRFLLAVLILLFCLPGLFLTGEAGRVTLLAIILQVVAYWMPSRGQG